MGCPCMASNGLSEGVYCEPNGDSHPPLSSELTQVSYYLTLLAVGFLVWSYLGCVREIESAQIIFGCG